MASKSDTRVQIPIRDQGKATCPDHQSEVMFGCKLVCLECVTYTHQGHKFDKIADLASNKKHKIQDYVKKLEKNGITTNQTQYKIHRPKIQR